MRTMRTPYKVALEGVAVYKMLVMPDACGAMGVCEPSVQGASAIYNENYT